MLYDSSYFHKHEIIMELNVYTNVIKIQITFIELIK
jgi:hypothetical protein